MDRIKNDTNRIVMIATCVVFCFFHYGLGIMVSYQPDIYLTINDPDGLVADYYSSGRFVMGFIFGILRGHNRSYYAFYYISLLISICLIIVSTYLFAALIKDQMIKRHIYNSSVIDSFLISIVACLTVANLFSAEFFLYPNSTVGYVLDILLCIVASRLFAKMQEQGYSISRVIIVLLLLLIAVLIYEPILAIFVIISTLIALVDFDNIKAFFFSQFCCALMYGFAMGVKFYIAKIVVKTSRADFGVSTLPGSVQTYNNMGISPAVLVFDRITLGMWAYALVSAAIVICMVYNSLKTRQWLNVTRALYLSCVIVIMGMLPFIMGVSDDYKPRLYYPLGLFLGIMIIYGRLSGDIDIGEKAVKTGICVLTVVLLVFQWTSFVQMYVDQYETNYEDRYISQMIGECIDKYERDTGEKIKYVSFYSDSVRTKFIRTVGWCLTQRAYDAPWSKLPVLNYYLNRQYEQGEIDADKASYFLNRDWNVFSPDQLIFDGDSVHICTF